MVVLGKIANIPDVQVPKGDTRADILKYTAIVAATEIVVGS